jgi:hypothetical protein
MSLLDLNNDVKSIISKHLSGDLNVSKMFMKVIKIQNFKTYVIIVLVVLKLN